MFVLGPQANVGHIKTSNLLIFRLHMAGIWKLRWKLIMTWHQNLFEMGFSFSNILDSKGARLKIKIDAELISKYEDFI